MDRADVAVVESQLAPDYVHFEGDVVDREHELSTLRTRGTGPHIATRTWSHRWAPARRSSSERSSSTAPATNRTVR
jgi:hypothetical protein